MSGGTIVTGMFDVTLHTGDTLTFTFSESGYQGYAPKFGAPAAPSSVSYSLVAGLADAIDAEWVYSAELQSMDGATSVAFGNENTAAGYLQGSLYHGQVTTASGQVKLAPEVAAKIFGNSAARLVLRDLSGDVTIGLSPYTLGQDMRISLSGGGLSVGGMLTSVTLEPSMRVAGDAPGQNTPEPGYGLPITAASVLAWLAARIRRRRRAGQTQ